MDGAGVGAVGGDGPPAIRGSDSSVYVDAAPAIASVVKIGTVLSRVVRQFNGGFAVTFLTMQSSHSIEANILQPELRPAAS